MDRFDSGREDDLPFNSVIRSARWRALKERRISVGQIKWRKQTKKAEPDHGEMARVGC